VKPGETRGPYFFRGTFTCPQCGLSGPVTTTNKKFCSKQCRNTYNSEHDKARNSAYYLANKEKIASRNRRWYSQNKEYYIQSQKSGKLQRDYGISLVEYESMYEEQGGLCAICFREESAVNRSTGTPWQLSVDHNHQTGAVRGLLCMSCNLSLGRFDESIDRLRSAIAYLEKWQSK